jgi:prepilin-type N-terminal cleavage/methylation domain-containing protein
MSATMKRPSAAGFTLLEVLLATSIMAVGTTSVLVVIATAAGMASQRQVNLRREQVIDEARHEAQAVVDAFRPGKQGPAAPAPKAPKSAKAETAAPANAPAKIENKQSSRFAGFSYDIVFTPQDRQVPEKGYQVAITVHYGGGELHATANATMISTTIPDEEFTTSATWEEERTLGGGQKQTGAKKP